MVTVCGLWGGKRRGVGTAWVNGHGVWGKRAQRGEVCVVGMLSAEECAQGVG